MRTQNIVIFSSGISESNGILQHLKDNLESMGCHCQDWRDLFEEARDVHNISVLPMLIKKIPSFDFGILIAEGHDITVMKRKEDALTMQTMRDNVLFEIGLCVMALGIERTILLSDGHVRLPEDLQGKRRQPALPVVIYDSTSYLSAAQEVTALIQNEVAHSAASSIRDYIEVARNSLSPTIVGAAVASANAYVSNFILRLLEQIDKGVLLEEGKEQLTCIPDNKVYVHIILPELYRLDTPSCAQAKLRELKKGVAPFARFRNVEFYYRLDQGELHIIDYPTNLASSYHTARLILHMDADDKRYDTRAEYRFNAKELDLYESALRTLLCEDFIKEVVTHFYEDDTEEENLLISRLVRFLPNISIEKEDY